MRPTSFDPVSTEGGSAEIEKLTFKIENKNPSPVDCLNFLEKILKTLS